jgi:hypothetical protein
VAGPRGTVGNIDAPSRADLVKQHQRLENAAKLCHSITFQWLLPENIGSLDLFLLDLAARRAAGQSRVEAETTYIEILHQLFAIAFAGIDQRIKRALPQFKETLALLDRVSPGHMYPSVAESEAELSRLAVRMRTLRSGIANITVHTLEATWQAQTSGCTGAIKQCEVLYKSIQSANAQAAAEQRLITQEGLTRVANSHSDDANKTAKKALEVAVKADKTGRSTKWWTAGAMVVALFALGWDAYKWSVEQSKKAAERQQPAAASSPSTARTDGASSP